LAPAWCKDHKKAAAYEQGFLTAVSRVIEDHQYITHAWEIGLWEQCCMDVEQACKRVFCGFIVEQISSNFVQECSC
jgi:hypothetical protein